MISLALTDFSDKRIDDPAGVLTLLWGGHLQLIDNRPHGIGPRWISHQQVGGLALVGICGSFEEILVVGRVAAFDPA